MRRSQQQKMSRSFTGTPAVVNHAAQHCKKFRSALHFIHDHKLAKLRVEKGPWIAQQSTISLVLEVKIKRVCSPIIGNSACQGRLADLTRSEQDDTRHMVQAFADKLVETTGYHAFILKDMPF